MTRRRRQGAGKEHRAATRRSAAGLSPSLLGRFRTRFWQSLGRRLAMLGLLTLSTLTAFHVHPLPPPVSATALKVTATGPHTAPLGVAPALGVLDGVAPAHHAPPVHPPDDDKACILCQAIQALTALAPTSTPPLLAPGTLVLAQTRVADDKPSRDPRPQGPQQPRAPPAQV